MVIKLITNSAVPLYAKINVNDEIHFVGDIQSNKEVVKVYINDFQKIHDYLIQENFELYIVPYVFVLVKVYRILILRVDFIKMTYSKDCIITVRRCLQTSII